MDKVPMICSSCKSIEEYSPLRLGKKCGKCKSGKWIPYNGPKAKSEKETIVEEN